MRKILFDLTDRVAVVTGAARGLGKASAVGLAAYGANVAVIDLAAEDCRSTVVEIEALKRRAAAYACDVADEEAVRKTVPQIVADFGRIDILVNIAGITARVPTAEIPAETVRRLMEVNYYGHVWLCQEVGKVMLAQHRGSIINMSALGGGFLGLGRGNAAYCSTKGAISALTRDLACEWGAQGIRVNAVAPAWFPTEMNVSSIFASKSFVEQLMTKLPMKRLARLEEIVGPVVFLASDASSMITGHVLPIDGGANATCPIQWNPD